MARSDTVAPIEVRWDPKQRRWIGDGVRATTLGRANNMVGPSDFVVPAGLLAEEFMLARAEVRAAEVRLREARHRQRQVMRKAIGQNVPPADVAFLLGTSRQNIDRQLREVR